MLHFLIPIFLDASYTDCKIPLWYVYGQFSNCILSPTLLNCKLKIPKYDLNANSHSFYGTMWWNYFVDPPIFLFLYFDFCNFATRSTIGSFLFCCANEFWKHNSSFSQLNNFLKQRRSTIESSFPSCHSENQVFLTVRMYVSKKFLFKTWALINFTSEQSKQRVCYSSSRVYSSSPTFVRKVIRFWCLFLSLNFIQNRSYFNIGTQNFLLINFFMAEISF